MFVRSIELEPLCWPSRGYQITVTSGYVTYDSAEVVKRIFIDLGIYLTDIQTEYMPNNVERTYIGNAFDNIAMNLVYFGCDMYNPKDVNNAFGNDCILIAPVYGMNNTGMCISPKIRNKKIFDDVMDEYANIKALPSGDESFKIQLDFARMEADTCRALDNTISNYITSMTNYIEHGMGILMNTVNKYPEKIIFNGDTTICLWRDGSKTFVKRHGNDVNDYAFSATLCILKKHLGDGSTAKMHKIFNAIDEVENSEANNKVIKLNINGNVEGHN